MVKADIDEGRREAPNPDERAELVELRRKLRVSEMENYRMRSHRARAEATRKAVRGA